MPFMDESMIDLFGEDAVQDNIVNALVAAPETGALIDRIDLAHASGCSQHIAWSRTGCVAHLVEDGHKIEFSILARDPTTAVWSFSASPPQTLTAPEDVVFVHIEWSISGLDLLAFDAFGRPYWYTSAYAIGRLQQSPMNVSARAGDNYAVVGTHWLPIHPIQHKVQSMMPATRNGNEWFCKLRVNDAQYMHNPVESKFAFFTISRSGMVRLFYQNDKEPWSESKFNLGEPTDSGYLLSHAAFANGPDFVYLATYDLSRRLRLYKVSVDWNSDFTPDNRPMAIRNAQINVEYLDVDNHCSPRPATDTNSLVAPQSIVRAQLSSLSFIPVPPSDTNLQSTDYQILGMYTYVDSQSIGQQLSASCSVIARWDIDEKQHVLHDSFVGPEFKQPKSTTSDTTTGLTRLDDVVLPRIVLSTMITNFETTMVITCSDGTIEFRDRETFDLILPDGSDSHVSGLPQAGFTYLSSDRCADIALSYSGCMAALVRTDGTVELQKMEYLQGWTDPDLESYQTQAALICIAREFAAMTASNNVADEILALVPPTLSQRGRRFLIDHMYRMLSKTADISSEEAQRQAQRVMRDNVLHRIMGGQLILSYADTQPLVPDIPRKIVWIIQNLRTICTSVATTVTTREQVRPLAVATLKDVITWTTNLQIRILADLFALHRALPSHATTIAAAKATLTDIPVPSPSLHLLLCSPSRALLRFASEIIKAFFSKLPSVRPESQDQASLIRELKVLATTLPFRMQHFETLVADADQAVRKAHANAGSSPQSRAGAEHAMLVHGELPVVMEGAVEGLLKGTVGRLMESVDVGEVFFKTWGKGVEYEVAVAGVSGEKGRYDVLRKGMVEQDVGVKRCRRCGSCIASGARFYVPWIVMGTRFCVCSGHWTVLSEGTAQRG
ncbi:hypothetical protein MBLNU457_5612t1 [Dothideomycetes sp. NU457]